MAEDTKYADPELIIHKIDWEGWPDALEWLVGLQFEDKELDQMIYDAAQVHYVLEGWHRTITNKLAEMGFEL